MGRHGVSVDEAWMGRKFPLPLRFRALRKVARVGSMTDGQIDHAFKAAWRRGCDHQVAILFAVFWRRPGDHDRPRRNVALAYAQLRDNNPPYKLNSVRGLKEKHVRVLLERWEREGMAAETVRKRITELRDFTEWLEKRHVVDNVLRARNSAQVERELKRR